MEEKDGAAKVVGARLVGVPFFETLVSVRRVLESYESSVMQG
jgi:hypothetical protein